jgi:ribosomal protein L7/L12
MKITKINVPTYKVDKKLLNHFELLKLQTDIANKRKKGNVSVKCLTTGQTFKILKSGKVNSRTKGYNLMVSLAKELNDAVNDAVKNTISEDEIQYLLHGAKLCAVKMHKEKTGKSLYDAKQFIDEFVKSKRYKKLYDERGLWRRK